MSDTPSKAARTIAAGGNPLWTETFTHPVHGELVFRARLPLASDSLRHSVELDNRLQDLAIGVEPSLQTQILAAALAGMAQDPAKAPGHGLLVELPVIDSDETEDPDTGKVTVTRHFYDASSEPRLKFLTDVWLSYSSWRNEQLSDDTVSAVGESSGAPSTS